MRVLEFLGIEIFALLFFAWFVLTWIRSRKKSRTTLGAYFSGGPLDGKVLKLETLPPVYTHYEGRGKSAVYKTQGNGVYLFDDYVYELVS